MMCVCMCVCLYEHLCVEACRCSDTVGFIPVVVQCTAGSAQRLPPAPSAPTDEAESDGTQSAEAPGPSNFESAVPTGYSTIYEYLQDQPEFTMLVSLIDAAPPSADIKSEHLLSVCVPLCLGCVNVLMFPCPVGCSVPVCHLMLTAVLQRFALALLLPR